MNANAQLWLFLVCPGEEGGCWTDAQLKPMLYCTRDLRSAQMLYPSSFSFNSKDNFNTKFGPFLLGCNFHRLQSASSMMGNAESYTSRTSGESLLAIPSSGTVRGKDIQNPSSFHTAVVLSACRKWDVPDECALQWIFCNIRPIPRLHDSRSTNKNQPESLFVVLPLSATDNFIQPGLGQVDPDCCGRCF